MTMTMEETHNILEDVQRILTAYRYLPKELTDANGNAILAVETVMKYGGIEKVVDACEKQVPKKPLCINDNDTFDGNWKVVCPSCHAILKKRITTDTISEPYIYNDSDRCLCGQKLDIDYENTSELIQFFNGVIKENEM